MVKDLVNMASYWNNFSEYYKERDQELRISIYKELQ